MWHATGDTATAIDCPEQDGLGEEVPQVAVYCNFPPEDLGREVLVASRKLWQLAGRDRKCPVLPDALPHSGQHILGFYEPRQDPLESGGSGGGGGNSAPEGFDRQGEAPAGGTGLGPAA